MSDSTRSSFTCGTNPSPITVAAGQIATIEISVLPRKRTLRIVSGGDVTAVTGLASDDGRQPPNH